MKRTVHYHPTFANYVSDAVAWLDARVQGLGAELVQAVSMQLNAVIENPESCPKVRGEIRRSIVRRFRYLIFYRYRDNEVLFLGMVYGARDVSAWLGSRLGSP